MTDHFPFQSKVSSYSNITTLTYIKEMKKMDREDADIIISNTLQQFNEKILTTIKDQKEEPRLFFPHGINLISISLDVFNTVKFEFKLAGEKADEDEGLTDENPNLIESIEVEAS